VQVLLYLLAGAWVWREGLPSVDEKLFLEFTTSDGFLCVSGEVKNHEVPCEELRKHFWLDLVGDKLDGKLRNLGLYFNVERGGEDLKLYEFWQRKVVEGIAN
jgi:hypothetical protein